MRILLKVILIVTAILIISHQDAYAADLSPKARASLQRLMKESRSPLEVYWNDTMNTPSILKGELSRPSKHTPEWIAYKYLNKTKALYGIQFPNRDMKIIGVDRSHSGRIRVSLQHLLYRTPVWGDSMMIEIDDDGVIRQVQSRIHPYMEKKLFYRPMHASVSFKKAAAIAEDVFQKREVAVEEMDIITYYLPTRPGTPLIYAVMVRNQDTGVETTLFIHAVTGRVIDPNPL
ncbi:hypothetical protein [Paenibacillus mendelii]|uniref:PepSY domain-containing protein n=1 Tax=Paenibacillus mendelii TaxID=206163 RepID=A0ABV6J6X5_9BACL|nr:hypothetical protein [Paenibacillus mendelii]MCQ6560024.1 hypothetical protein [Paenibacillus mendelii]